MRTVGGNIKMPKITIKGDFSFEDKEAREYLDALDTRLVTVNDRTKQHTQDIKAIERRLKEWKQDKE